MNIEEAKPSDHSGIIRLYLQFNEDRVKSGVGDAHYKHLDGELPWKNTLTDPDCTTLVAREKGIVIGFITVRLTQSNPFGSGRMAEIDLVVVDKMLRRRGIGRLLYDAALVALKGSDISHILLNVKKGNVPAVLFWAKLGFRKVSGTEYVRADGVEEETLYMLKPL